MRPITVEDSSGEKLQADVVRVDSIEKKTTRNDNEYVRVTARNGDRYSCWEDSWQNELLENPEKYEGAVWEVVYILKQGKYKNIKYLTEPDEDQLKEYEADADLLEDVPRDVRIRKSTALNVASRIMESGASPERVVETAKEVDRAFVDWLTEGDDTR